MSKRAVRRARRNLAFRQTEFDAIKSDETKKGMKRPGSLNPHKSIAARKRR